jgi:hypothetical protein
MRLAIAGIVAAGLLVLTLILGWSGSTAWRATAVRDQDWRQRELLFLKDAYERVVADLDGRPSRSPSLSAERDRILRNMAETGKLLPAERIPPEVARLLATAAEPPRPETIAELIEAVVAEPIPDFRIGLGKSQDPELDLAEFVVDPLLRQPISDPLLRQPISPQLVERKAAAEPPPTPRRKPQPPDPSLR